MESILASVHLVLVELLASCFIILGAIVEPLHESVAVARLGHLLDDARKLRDELLLGRIVPPRSRRCEVVPEGAAVQGQSKKDAVDGGLGRGNASLATELDGSQIVQRIEVARQISGTGLDGVRVP